MNDNPWHYQEPEELPAPTPKGNEVDWVGIVYKTVVIALAIGAMVSVAFRPSQGLFRS